jgi:UDP-N-acetylmuramoylalanine--D-glutamate ligase
MELKGKKVLVVGLARSGVAAARLLALRGAIVMANDAKPESELAAQAAEMRKLGVMLSMGSHPDSLFENADLIVASPGVPADIAPLESARRAGVEIISEPELAGRFLKGRMIGITGSNGKTTTTTLAGELMQAAGAEVVVGGNIGTPLTSLVEKTTDSSWTVAELSSFQLETIQSLRVNVAVVTNITPDHLDRHGSMENYVRAKHRIFSNQAEGDWAVLNADDPGVADMVAKLGVGSRKIYFSSAGQDADIYARAGSIYTTLVTADRSEVEVIPFNEISVPGMHNVENIMAALGATICAQGVEQNGLPALRDAIKQFKGVEHRIEHVTEIEGVRFYNDSKATNVDSTAKALEAFAGNVILILGGKDKGSDYTVLAPLVRERVKQIILIGAASDIIAEQLHDLRPMTRAHSMDDAVLKAMEVAAAGDTVLLAPACASFDMFENYEHRGREFKQSVYKLVSRIHSGWTGRLTT